MMAGGTLQRYPGIRFQLFPTREAQCRSWHGDSEFCRPRLSVTSGPPAHHGRSLDVQRWIRSFYYDTALSASEPAMRAVLSVTDRSHIVFGSDWPFSQMVYTGSGDPAPGLGTVFNATEVRNRAHQPPAATPRLKSAI